MSLLLSRLGSFSYRKPFVIIVMWALIVAGVITMISQSDTQLKTSLTVDGTPAQETLDLVSDAIPEAGGTQGSITLKAIDASNSDLSTEESLRALDDVVTKLYALPEVVDPSERLDEARATAMSEASDIALERANESISGQLPQLVERLDSTIAEMEQMAAAMQAGTPPAGGPPGGGMPQPQDMPAGAPMDPQVLQERLASLQTLRTDAAAAIDMTGEEQLQAVDDLLVQIRELSAQGGMDSLSLETPEDFPLEPQELLAEGTSVVDALDEQVTAMVDAQFDELNAVREGPNPAGNAAVIDGEVMPGVTLSKDGSVALVNIQLSTAKDDLPTGRLEEIEDTIQTVAADDGFDVAISQSLLPLSPPVGGQEVVGIVVAAIILFITLGSLVAAGLPIVTALVGVVIGVGGAFGLSEHYSMTSTTPILALMLGLAVGIDYALFIVNKQRHYILKEKMSAHDATARAVGTSGTAVVFAGSTVIIALLGLLVIGVEFVSVMALVAAATVAIAVFVAITLFPALLGLAKERVVSRRVREKYDQREARQSPEAPAPEKGFFYRWVSLATRRPLVTVGVVVILLAIVAVPVKDMRLGMPSGAVAPAGATERVHYDTVSDSFGEGLNGPLVGVVENDSATELEFSSDPLAEQRDVIDSLMEITGVENVSFQGMSDDGAFELYQIQPSSGPMAEETEDLVNRLRAVDVDGVDADIEVTGLTAINIDLSDRLTDALPTYIGIVVILSLIILLFVFRSIPIPIMATVGFLLTLAATLGIITAVFGTSQLGWLAGVDREGVVLSFLPIMATGVLYGLAMDYQIFLTTSIREAHTHGMAARPAVIEGFRRSAKVIVAAATIMISVFGAFILTDEIMVKQFGLALAIGILIDAFVVRMTLMPALIYIMDERAWRLPGWLDRILPNLDVEGSKLESSAPADASSQ